MRSEQRTADGGGIRTEAPQPGGAPPERALELVRRRELRFIDFWFTDLGGRPWRITLRADKADASVLTAGIVLDGRTVGAPWDSFIRLLPDASAGFVDPVAAAPTLALFCDVGAREPEVDYPYCARRALRRASARVAQAAGGELAVGIEPEFFLLDGGRPAAEERLREFLRQMAEALADAGVEVDWFRIGPGDGQGRVQMRAASPLLSADRVQLYKHVARALAVEAGLQAVFLPKPLAGPASAGMPVHHALFSGGRNLFHDPEGWAGTSPQARGWAAGLLAHAPALLAFCAPTTNSYRRLLAGTGAPVEACLSSGRRSAAVRVPAGSIGTADRNKRVKFVSGDPSANPYLMLAAQAAAGVDGLERGLAPALEEPPAGSRLPDSLEEALAALARDAAFLTKDDVLPQALLERWTADRWQTQVLPVRERPHPVELEAEGL